MNTIRCEGLDGSNPLHMMASIGAFRLLCLSYGDARMFWTGPFPWRPVFLAPFDESEVAARLAACFGWEASSTEPGTGGKARRSTRSGSKGGATGRSGRVGGLYPVAAGAEIIKRPAADFRELAEDLLRNPDVSPVQHELAAAMASDAVTDQTEAPVVTPSLFSFSNKQSGKCLLKDFLNCAATVTEQSTLNTLTRCDANREDVTTLRWDPTEQRSYAMQWGDPGDRRNRVSADATLNAMAFVGFAAFPSMPIGRSLATTGFGRGSGEWSWPIWSPALRLDVIRSLLADATIQAETPDRAALAMRGVEVVFRSRRMKIGKPPTVQYFFSPSRPA